MTGLRSVNKISMPNPIKNFRDINCQFLTNTRYNKRKSSLSAKTVKKAALKPEALKPYRKSEDYAPLSYTQANYSQVSEIISTEKRLAGRQIAHRPPCIFDFTAISLINYTQRLPGISKPLGITIGIYFCAWHDSETTFALLSIDGEPS